MFSRLLGRGGERKFAVSNVKFFGEMFIEIAKLPEYVAFTLAIVLVSRMLISYFWTSSSSSSSSSSKRKNNNTTINSEEISRLVKLHLDRAVKDLKVSLASSPSSGPSSDVSSRDQISPQQTGQNRKSISIEESVASFEDTSTSR